MLFCFLYSIMYGNIIFSYGLFSISAESFSTLVKIRTDIIKNPSMFLNEEMTAFLFWEKEKKDKL